MQLFDKKFALGRHEVFSCLTQEERTKLLSLAHEETFAAGQTLFQEGDEGSYALLILSGSLRITLGASDGKELMLILAGPGEIIGEMALIDGLPRSASVRAEEDTLCLRIGREGFVNILEKNPNAMLALLRVLSLRLRRTTDQMEMIALQALPARLARYVLQLAKESGTRTGTGWRVDSGLKQSDIAEHLAASREAVNKLLNIWQAKGLISLLPQQGFVLKDINFFEEMAEF